MVKKKTKDKEIREQMKGKNWCRGRCHSSTGGIYGLGMFGALVYYISTAGSFWLGVLGVLKSLVWPAFLIYEALKFLGA